MSVYETQFDVTKTIKTKITVSDSESIPSGIRSPEYLLNNDVYGTFDGNKRWAVFGNNHFIDFEFDQMLTVYGISIGWYQANEFRYTFKIKSNSVNHILFNGVSTGLTGSYETYEFDRPVNTRNIRILCNGNLEDEWTRISAIKFRLDPIPAGETTIDPFPSCPEGQHWHEALQRCIPNHITEPPIIKITEQLQTVKQGDNVLIDASQTTDPIGANLFYEWVQIAGELVNTGSKLQSNLIFRAPTIDTELKFRLIVTNSGDLKSYKDATVVVRAEIPLCPPGQYWDEESKKCLDIPPKPKPEPEVKSKPKKRSRKQQ